ncbi:MAG TPA: acyl-CoA dehydrogenase family protein [Anaerolineae bacterium]|nr:acyl-CoA dehydrogenase family protein [Anaerolineae bacterium]HOR00123.1 acyl-CoA dehydrogenase family protein [Anaerolineae bacterium]HPL28182.1 acyl-CoA dehydrogenase family protein [Anaerolineae bacterium]
MLDAMLTPAQKDLRDEVRDFVRWVPRQLILDMDDDKVRYPREYVAEAARRRLLGLRFPVELGGRGLGWADEIVALEEVGVLGTSLACLYSLPSIVGEAIARFGTPQQQARWLPAILSGRLAVAEALTEPRGGSDFFGTTTKAQRDGDDYVLDGQKRFVVGAEGADLFLVYARTDPQARPHEGLSAFIAERGPEGDGIQVAHVYGLMGTRGGGTGRLTFRGARVPAANLIGPENGAAAVFYQMMIPERMTSAAGALGMGRAALEIAARYAERRKAFGHKIRAFEGVSFKIADSITALDAARLLVYGAARAVDAGDDPRRCRRLVSEAKKFATETAWQVVNHAMQIMGGIGYTRVYPVERLLRDTRLIMIWTGTNEIMDLIIQSEYQHELLAGRGGARDMEGDAADAELSDEKVYE